MLNLVLGFTMCTTCSFQFNNHIPENGSLMVSAVYHYFSEPQNIFLSCWCDALSISAIGEFNVKSQLFKYPKNSCALERYGWLSVVGV